MDVQLIGAITGNDVCDYFFVSKACISLESILKERFPQEVMGVIVREHDDFEIYKSVLFPNEYQLAMIYNQNLCLNLEREGERFEVERDVEVLTVFERQEDAQLFSQHFEQFAHTQTIEPREDGLIQTRMIASIVPTLPTMNGISQHIVSLTNQYNGSYEGWYCNVHK
ncbi:ribonuclease E inhibitor RraB [Erysipelothrix piscisicarius]|uniref:ribonuclease E inhibitor RraB n=2 Tax=Erysipelotrichaceae TaxID=128827 RepID=UPI001E649752|nr:ribonuclease E inhibitor RraB [Erysipelothrix piscisicarius]